MSKVLLIVTVVVGITSEACGVQYIVQGDDSVSVPPGQSVSKSYQVFMSIEGAAVRGVSTSIRVTSSSPEIQATFTSISGPPGGLGIADILPDQVSAIGAGINTIEGSTQPYGDMNPLRVTLQLQASVAATSATVTIDFVDGLQGSGGPVHNEVSVQGEDTVPTMTNIVINVSIEPDFIRGDGNASGRVGIGDAIAVLGYLFLGDPLTLQCLDAADADDNETVQMIDAIVTLQWLILGTFTIPAPGPMTCGQDGTPTAVLDCTAFPPCTP